MLSQRLTRHHSGKRIAQSARMLARTLPAAPNLEPQHSVDRGTMRTIWAFHTAQTRSRTRRQLRHPRRERTRSTACTARPTFPQLCGGPGRCCLFVQVVAEGSHQGVSCSEEGMRKRRSCATPHSPPESCMRPGNQSPECGQSRSWLPMDNMYGTRATRGSICSWNLHLWPPLLHLWPRIPHLWPHPSRVCVTQTHAHTEHHAAAEWQGGCST